MQFNLSEIPASSAYKLLTGLIVPRPIAWVTTLNENGTVNAAPFSFFNAMGSDPALIALGIGNHPDRPKDTARNIERTGEFVVNLVPLALAQSMSDSATDFPAEMSEVDELGLQVAPSKLVSPPRIAGCPAALECKWERTVHIGNNRIVFGAVQLIFVEQDKMLDAERLHVDSNKLDLIGRMGGLGGYTDTHGSFHIERKTYDQSK